MNIVMLSEHDYAGSGWRMVEAIRHHTQHNIVHVKVTPHRYGYKTDYLLSSRNLPIVAKIVEQADIIHFKGDEPPVREWHAIRIPFRAKTVVTVGGSIFRRHGEAKSGASMARHPLSRYMGCDIRTALSPDLNYPEFKARYTPYVIGSEAAPYSWHNGDRMRIGYYPGRMGLKGDRTHILPALEALKKEFDFEVVPIQNMTYEESVKVKAGLTLFIDQISEGGCYGNSGIEAMQFGVPVIAYISERSLRQCGNSMFRDSPVLNPGPTVEGLVKLLKKVLSGEVDLNGISKQTKHYCDGFHGYQVNAGLWDGIYGRLS